MPPERELEPSKEPNAHLLDSPSAALEAAFAKLPANALMVVYKLAIDPDLSDETLAAVAECGVDQVYEVVNGLMTEVQRVFEGDLEILKWLRAHGVSKHLGHEDANE